MYFSKKKNYFIKFLKKIIKILFKFKLFINFRNDFIFLPEIKLIINKLFLHKYFHKIRMLNCKNK